MHKNVKSTVALAAAGMMAAAAANEQHTNVYEIIPTLATNPPIIDWGTSPKYFGQWYAGSSLKRKNNIRRKHYAKYHKR